MKKTIEHLTGSIRPDLDVRFVAKPLRAVQTFFPTKDRVPKRLQSDTVYATSSRIVRHLRGHDETANSHSSL
jgi:hypothetical protein